MVTGYVCPFGQFKLFCIATDGTVMRWTIDFLGVTEPGDRIISTTSPESLPPFVIGDSSSVLLISRTSLSPLTSLLETITTQLLVSMELG